MLACVPPPCIPACCSNLSLAFCCMGHPDRWTWAAGRACSSASTRWDRWQREWSAAEMPAGCRCLYPPPAPQMCSLLAQKGCGLSLPDTIAAGQIHRFRPLAPPCSVVNCAAQAAPAACEGEGEAAARAVNIPHRLLDALEAHSRQHGRSVPFPRPPCLSQLRPPCAASSPPPPLPPLGSPAFA